ncbi:putative transposase (plasmid) [Solidesulfovibrio magneticus RS-1]|uniref:Transposase n=1 Tax=Solidesulfovibrio magneticus (strain ATCC 700980 / DSM 13731 / RS-1) TaxID=573370 RepID=C4XUI8_SOLM1|nr:putative transposase [Solidesulfovibrio magneticus RS-1]
MACHSESLAALKRGVQEALFRLGHAPKFHQTDNSTAATHDLTSGKRDFNAEYLDIMNHFGMIPRTIAVGEKEQNGDVETTAMAENQGWSHQRFLQYLAEFELEERRQSRIERLRKASGLPSDKTLASLDKTQTQVEALQELESEAFATGIAYRVKEQLRWIRRAETSQAAKWRSTNFLNYASELIAGEPLLKPVAKALKTYKKHRDRILFRWCSWHTNARLEGLNGLFQAVRARARGYRNVTNFITMIYLIAAPIADFLAQ